MERAIHIEKRDITDLGDLLHIARAIGRKIFNVDRVNINPQIAYVPNGYVVMVSPQEHNGKLKSDVERKKIESNPKKP